MIFSLPGRLRALLTDALAALITAPDQQVAERPPDDFAGQALPLLVVSSGSMEFNPRLKEPGAGQPALQERRQEFKVSSTSPTGPFKLSQQPLAGSLRCVLRAPDGAARALTLGDDVDYEARLQRLTLSQAASAGSTLLVRYDVAVAEVAKAFDQRVSVEIYAEKMSELEQWSALALAALLTNQEALLAPPTPEPYVSGLYSVHQRLDQLELVELVPERRGAICCAGIRLRASGRLLLARSIEEGSGVIVRVRSATRSGDSLVDVDVGLDLER